MRGTARQREADRTHKQTFRHLFLPLNFGHSFMSPLSTSANSPIKASRLGRLATLRRRDSAAINHEFGSGYAACPIRSDERDQVRHLVRSSWSAERDAAQ